GQPRPRGTTLLRWSRRAGLSHVHKALLQLANRADASRYAPTIDDSLSKTCSEAQVKELLLLEHQLSLRSLQRPEATTSAQPTLATT
ncbi:MAG: hypothetical protein KDA81_22875, partial [Planctomycetaceae bacterium]|nr:hypothetical protein [Planctomycetaceae bacterium]